MKRPWFIWLSLFGFIGLFAVLALKQFFQFFKGSFDTSRWVIFLFHSIGLFVLLVMLQGVLFTILVSVFFVEQSAAGYVVQSVFLIYMYFICVFLNLQLYRWAKKRNIV